MTEPCRPFPRETLDPEAWTASVADHPATELLALWADTQRAHALLRENAAPDPAKVRIVSVEVVAQGYPALSPHRPAASLFERMIADLWGHAAEGAVDTRKMLDHGRWPATAPLSPKPIPGPPRNDGPFPFQRIDDDTLDEIPRGPVRGRIAEPSHLRVQTRGETILRAEARLGYAHKGILGLMRGKSPRAAARYASRLAGDATVAHSIAFARAAEAATGTEAPPRAQILRGVCAELERLVGHLFDLAATARAAGAETLAAQAMRLREIPLRAAAAAFDSRAMMDAVIPGGVAADISALGIDALLGAVDDLGLGLPALARAHAKHPGLDDRLRGAGRVTQGQAAAFAPGGVIGRAAGRAGDLRHSPGYPPYLTAAPRGPVIAEGGDAFARASARLQEAQTSVDLLRVWLMQKEIPDGPVSVPLPMASGEGIGFAESPRGDVWHWLRLDGGLIASVFLRDPAWLHWPLFESACVGAPLEDIALIEASFGLSAGGIDL